MPANIVETLMGFAIFKDVTQEAVEWVAAQAQCFRYAQDALMAKAGDPVSAMSVIVSGRVKFTMENNKGFKDLGDSKAGDTMGVLPFSRMTVTLGNVRACEETVVIQIDKSCYTDMVRQSYQLVQNLVGNMSDRIREFSEFRAQDEKMMSLGKLSAGLAHELNNPAAAVVRSAEALYQQLHTTPESFKRIMLMQVTPEEVDAVNGVIFERLRRLSEDDTRTTMDRLEASEAIEDWLGDRGLDVQDEMVESLVSARFDGSHLDQIHQIVDGRSMASLLEWIAKNIELEVLTAEIRDGASRISELVGSVKSYTHMDRAAGPQPLDVHEGLRTTLIMLKHKFKRKNVALAKDFDTTLPLVTAWGGQINQVYTNLIDNAIDAAADGTSGKPTVTVRTRCLPEGVCVEVEDNGPGIPEAYREEVFSPFFTTKPVGEGTGMGLDIVKKILEKHGTKPVIESGAGRTVVRFCLGGGGK